MQQRLRRVRWLARAALTGGVIASVGANILHAQPHPVSQVIAAWPPLALLLAVELISRVPVDRPVLAHTRRAVTASLAGIAAWMSYWHMAAVAAHYGEAGTAAYLWPLTVDGLVVVASISLVEIAGLMRPNRPATGPGPSGKAKAPSQPAPIRTVLVDLSHEPSPQEVPAVRAGATAAAVAGWRATHPQASVADIAAGIGRSPRQVRRVLASQAVHNGRRPQPADAIVRPGR